MDELKVFYSWQSDKKDIRKAIRKKLEKDIGTLCKQGYSIQLIEGPAGALGMAKIDDAVLKNIRECDVFVCDLTPIMETDDGKLMPNSNVLLEMGYALVCKGLDHMIGVANLQDCDQSKMPFDIRQMRTTPFADAKSLEFAKWIKPILDKAIEEREHMKQNYDCYVGTEQGDVELFPRFKEVFYCEKNTETPASSINSPVATAVTGNILEVMANISGIRSTYAVVKPRTAWTSTNLGFCEVCLIIANTGSLALDNCNLTITASNEGVEFIESNIEEHGIFPIIKTIDNDFCVASDFVSQHFARTINPDDTRITNSFFVTAPHNLKSFEFKWRLSHAGGEPLYGTITVKWNASIEYDCIEVSSNDYRIGTSEVLPLIKEEDD